MLMLKRQKQNKTNKQQQQQNAPHPWRSASERTNSNVTGNSQRKTLRKSNTTLLKSD